MMSAMTDTFLCPYCGMIKPDVERSEEHVIPIALGGGLTTDLVCDDCNQRAGKEVDRPFLDQLWILEGRHRHQIPDRYGKTPGPPVIPATLAAGSKVLAVLDRGGWYAKRLPTEEWHDAQTMTFGVDAADEDAVTTKMKRLDKKYGAGVTKQISRVEANIENPHINLTYEQSASAWPRMGAKIALSVARLRCPDAYLTSEPATWLRKLLWGDLTVSAPPGTGVSKHLTGEVVTDPVIRIVNPPPEHQIMLYDLGDGSSGVIFSLFGETRYFVRLGPGSGGDSGVFLLDPHKQKAEWLEWPAWETRLGERVMDADRQRRAADDTSDQAI
jgi:hypothetical protein